MQDLLVTQATKLPANPARPSDSGVHRYGWVPCIGPFVCEEKNRWVFRPLPQLSARQPPRKKDAASYAKTEKGAGVWKRFASTEPPVHRNPSSCRPKLFRLCFCEVVQTFSPQYRASGCTKMITGEKPVLRLVASWSVQSCAVQAHEKRKSMTHQ